MRNLVAALAVVTSSAALAQAPVNARAQRDKPYVILISFDGMKPQYLQRIDLPNFQRVMQRGVRSAGMIPTYPPKTFPNHYSIVTGMRAETHGIVSNRFWDPQRNERFVYSDSLDVSDGSWWGGEPLWVTAEKQGMRTASYFWVGSEAAIRGVRPSIWKRYDGRIPNFARVDSALAWLALPPERRPHLVTLYFSDTDGAGHDHGPLSPQLDTAAKNVDAALGRLLDGLQAMTIKDRVYLVLVSDHGMSETHPRWFAALDTLIDTAGVSMGDGTGPLANLSIAGGRARAVALRDSINRRMKHGRAYLRGELPKHLHYDRNPRIGDVVVVMEEHFEIGYANRPSRAGGNHGWDPTLPSMHAIFVASGPKIPEGKVIPSFENVDVYPWLAELLGLEPARGIDGKSGALRALIRKAQ
jgi:predicted AlkP superfamily pyrophosphatase or phosphodiesterase